MEDQSKKKVLIVDDDPTARMNLTQILQDDYRLFYAENAKEALERAGNVENMPDIILLDLFLGNNNLGYQVCKDLKSNPKTCYIPVIFITQSTEELFENKCLENGGVDYIVKPFKPDRIKTRIKIQLEMNGRLRTYQKGLLDLNERTKVIQTQMQDILKEHQEIISGLESLMKIPYPGKE